MADWPSEWTEEVHQALFARIVKRVVISLETGCWEWTGGKNPTGYGKIWFGRRNWATHQLMWVLTNGKVAEGLELDHLCRNRCCCNPAHLEAVTHQVNTARGEGGEKTAAMRRAKTHCRNAHPYSPENTYYYPNGERRCLACRRAIGKAYRLRKKEALNGNR